MYSSKSGGKRIR